MKDQEKTKEQLISELEELRREKRKRKRAEENLVHAQHLLQALMDNVPDAIYFKDAESRFTKINKAQADRLCLSGPKEALGKTDFDFWAEEYARLGYDQEKEIMKSGQTLIEEQQKPYLDGREGWVFNICLKYPENITKYL